MAEPVHRPTGQPGYYGMGGNVTRSNRRIGAALPRRHHPPKSSRPLVLFRIIVITIILFCIIWGYIIVKIASEINAPAELQPTPMLARPLAVPRNDARSRIGWMIRQKINRIELQLRQVPLLDVAHMNSPVLIFTFERADYLERTLTKVFDNHPAQKLAAKSRENIDGSGSDLRSSKQDSTGKANRIAGAPIVISQDGKNAEVQKVVEMFRQLFEMKLGVPLYSIEHPRSDVGIDPLSRESWSQPYKLLAAHYGWALNQVFSGTAYTNRRKNTRPIPTPPLPQRVIILEEDIEISNDFFSLMNATADLLDSDETLLAVSAFNDNGKKHFVSDAKRIVRSDFFPGLGWMMARSVWDDPPSHPGAGLKRDWAPGGYWDDWLRESAQRHGRQIIRPEVSRTFHIGNINGASAGEYNNMLSDIELEENDIQWEDQDLSHLDASSFADNYWNRVSRAKLVSTVKEAKNYVAHKDVRLVYSHFDEFRELAHSLNIMADEKAGVPRTAYEGIVEIRYGRGNFFVFLTPPYVAESVKPGHFGKKAWKEYTKESMMQVLGIKVVPVELHVEPEFGDGW